MPLYEVAKESLYNSSHGIH